MPLAKKSENFSTVNTTVGRYYHSNINPDIYYPSVTTIIGYNKRKGKKKSGSYCGPSAAIGSLVHYKCLKKFTSEILDMPSDPIWGVSQEEAQDRITRCMYMWKRVIEPLKLEPISVESVVYSIHPRYAGRIDMLCKVNRILTLLDIKTGIRYEPEHSYQAAAYVNALKWAPKQAIFIYLDAITDRNPSQLGTIHTYNRSDLEYAYDEFLNVYADFGGFLEPENFPH